MRLREEVDLTSFDERENRKVKNGMRKIQSDTILL